MAQETKLRAGTTIDNDKDQQEAFAAMLFDAARLAKGGSIEAGKMATAKQAQKREDARGCTHMVGNALLALAAVIVAAGLLAALLGVAR